MLRSNVRTVGMMRTRELSTQMKLKFHARQNSIRRALGAVLSHHMLSFEVLSHSPHLFLTHSSLRTLYVCPSRSLSTQTPASMVK